LKCLLGEAGSGEVDNGHQQGKCKCPTAAMPKWCSGSCIAESADCVTVKPVGCTEAAKPKPTADGTGCEACPDQTMWNGTACTKKDGSDTGGPDPEPDTDNSSNGSDRIGYDDPDSLKLGMAAMGSFLLLLMNS